MTPFLFEVTNKAFTYWRTNDFFKLFFGIYLNAFLNLVSLVLYFMMKFSCGLDKCKVLFVNFMKTFELEKFQSSELELKVRNFTKFRTRNRSPIGQKRVLLLNIKKRFALGPDKLKLRPQRISLNCPKIKIYGQYLGRIEFLSKSDCRRFQIAPLPKYHDTHNFLFVF